MSETELSARSRVDIGKLAQALLSVSADSQPGIASYIMSRGLMRMTWLAHAAIRFARWKHGYSASQAWLVVFLRQPEFASELIATTAEWIVSGKDADGEGIGGFNQHEVETLGALILPRNVVAQSATSA